MQTRQKITPCLWFDSQAEEAAKFYTSIFKNSRTLGTTRYDEAAAKAAGRPLGSVLAVAFELEGQKFTALNGGPVFGVSWQIVPTILPEMLQDKDPEKAKRVMAAMLQMKKLSIGGLKQAYEGR